MDDLDARIRMKAFSFLEDLCVRYRLALPREIFAAGCDFEDDSNTFTFSVEIGEERNLSQSASEILPEFVDESVARAYVSKEI